MRFWFDRTNLGAFKEHHEARGHYEASLCYRKKYPEAVITAKQKESYFVNHLFFQLISVICTIVQANSTVAYSYLR